MKKTIILVTVSLAMFMESVDTTIINTAIPVMAKSLNVHPINLKLALISYLLSLAVFIPVSGWTADKFGMKRVFIFALSVFTLSSIWCGFTNSLSQLIIARILQGLGGSMTLPVARLIILRVCEKHELISKMTIVVMIASIGMMLGPLLGGLITDHFSWRWIFWVNIPVGIFAILSSIIFLPDIPSQKPPPLDKLGFIFFGLGLSTLTLGLSVVSESDIPSYVAFFLIALALLLLSLYIKHSAHKKYPIVNIHLLKIRTFKVSVFGNLFCRISFGGIPFLIPLLLQIGLGFSPKLAGFLLTPIALGVFLVKPLSIHILRFFGYKKLLMINSLLVSISLCTFSTINAQTSLYTIGFFTFIYGFLISMQYTGMNSLAYAQVKPESMSSATSIMSTIQQIGQSFGVAISAIFVQFFGVYIAKSNVLSVHIFHETFIAMGILTAFSIFIFMQLSGEDGVELIGSSNQSKA